MNTVLELKNWLEVNYPDTDQTLSPMASAVLKLQELRKKNDHSPQRTYLEDALSELICH